MTWHSENPRIEKCLFVQYKPEHPSKAGRKVYPEEMDITTVHRDEDYMMERLPVLKSFWDRMYIWRETVGKHQAVIASNLVKSFIRHRILSKTGKKV